MTAQMSVTRSDPVRSEYKSDGTSLHCLIQYANFNFNFKHNCR